jgi:hypothetical protein
MYNRVFTRPGEAKNPGKVPDFTLRPGNQEHLGICSKVPEKTMKMKMFLV